MGVTLKVLRRGTHRSASLDDTLKRALRLAPVMGITRVANVTGLDSVGIPVVMVCRPNSRSVAVSQGKGIDLASARASGLMEAVELYHAETITLPLRLATYEELRYQHNVVEVDAFEQTVMWQSAQRQAGELRFDSNGHGDSVTLESLLDELRLEGPKYKEHRNEALRRFFALREAERLRLNVNAQRKRTTEAEFRQERDLVDTAALKHLDD